MHLKFGDHHLAISTAGFVQFDHKVMPLSSIETLDPENIGVALGISLLSRVQAELHVFNFICRPPSWIYQFRFGRTVLLAVPLDSWVRET